MMGSNDKSAETGPVQLDDEALGEMAGGYELKRVRVTSYQLSGAADGGSDVGGDGVPDIIVGSGAGGGGHIR